MDRSRSTCFTPGGTLLTHRSSFSNIFNTGMVKLAGKKDKSLREVILVENMDLIKIQKTLTSSTL